MVSSEGERLRTVLPAPDKKELVFEWGMRIIAPPKLILLRLWQRFIGSQMVLEKTDLDYEGMYLGIKNDPEKYVDALKKVVTGAQTLEISINGLIRSRMKASKADSLKSWLESPGLPISTKARLLRFSQDISDELLRNLLIMFKVRNKLAHEIMLPGKDYDELFTPLKEAAFESEFVRALPNDSKKFLLLVSQSAIAMFKRSESLDPNSVQHLELVGDFKEIDF